MKGLWVFILLASVWSNAAEVRFDAEEALPHSHPLPQGELERTCQLIESKPFENADLAYKIVIPAGWKDSRLISPVSDSKRGLVPIGLYAPEAGGAPVSIQLSFFKLDQDINVRDWLGWYATSTGLDAKAFRSYPEAKLPAWDLLASHTFNGVELLTRLSAFQAGSRIFVAACSCPATEYEKYKPMFARACDSFELKNPPEEKLAEKLQSVEDTSTGRTLTLRLPESWKVQALNPATQGVKAWQFSLNMPLNSNPPTMETVSLLFVKAFDRRAFERLQSRDLLESAISELKTARFEPGVEQHVERLMLTNLQGAAEIHYLPVKQADRDSEATVVLVESGSLILVVTSVRPAIKRNPWSWMVGKRALEILLNHSNLSRIAR